MTHKSKIKELVGRGLNSYHSKALKQIDRIEKKNKEQNYKIGNLVNELDNDYITKSEEGSVISLEHSKEGMVYIDELEGNTLVNYCADGAKELTLNDEIDTEGINVTLNNTIDNGIVDVSLEGETLVNVSNQKDPVAITKSYIVENSGNHIALQGEYDGKARPIIYGNTMVNYCVDGAKELTLNNEIDVEGTNVTLTDTIDNGKVDVVCEGNTLVNLAYKPYLLSSITYLDNKYVCNSSTNVDHSGIQWKDKSLFNLGETYTIILEVENTSSQNISFVSGFDMCGYGWKVVDTVNANSSKKIIFTKTYTNTEYPLYNAINFSTQQNGVSFKIHEDILILKGDCTNKEIPQYFEGMKSVGQDDENGHNIEILSRNKNFVEVSQAKVRYVWQSEYTLISNGGIEIRPTSTTGVSYVRLGGYKLKKGHVYKFTHNGSNSELVYKTCIWNGEGADTDFTNIDISSKPLDRDMVVDISLYVRNGSIDNVVTFYPQIEIGETSTQQTIGKANTKTLTLNEPLRSVGDVKDKIVKIGGKWYVERNCGELVLDGSQDCSISSSNGKYPSILRLWVKNISDLKEYEKILCDKLPIAENKDYPSIVCTNGLDVHLPLSNDTSLEVAKQWLSENPIKVVYTLATPIYEPLEIEPTLNTYNDTTYISNNSIIPCNMKVKNTGYNCILHPNTKYTVTLNTNKSEAIEVNLGGTKVVTTNNVATITTPSILTNNNLELYGKGVKVSNVMVFEGDVTSNLPSGYVEGLKSCFENQLVTDKNDPNYGKYKVEYKVVGKNKFNEEWEAITINQDNGNIHTTTIECFSDFIDLKGYTTLYHLVIGDENLTARYFKTRFYNANYEYLGKTDVWHEGNRYIVPANARYLRISWYGRTISEMENVQVVISGTPIVEYEPYKEYTKTFYLNSPLLEGDTIEDINGKATHIKRYQKLILDGSSDEYYTHWVNDTGINVYTYSSLESGMENRRAICNRLEVLYGNQLKITKVDQLAVHQSSLYSYAIYISSSETTIDDFRNSLSNKNIVIVYQLKEPVYETISEESIICDSYVNGHLDVDTNVPVEKVEFMPLDLNLNYLYTNTMYTIKFNSDKSINGVNIKLGGAELLNQNIITGTNKFNITTPTTLLDTKLIIDKEGANISNVSVVATELEFDYFEGMKSVGECEDNKIEILGRNKNLFDKNNSEFSRLYIPSVGVGNEGTFFQSSGLRSVTFKCEKNTDYTISRSSDGYAFRIYGAKEKPSTGVKATCLFVDNDKLVATINSEDFSCLQIVYYSYNVAGSNETHEQEVINSLQIEYGKTKTNYVDYNINKKEITLSEPLRALPNGVTDKIVKIGGKYYIERNVNEVVINSLEGLGSVSEPLTTNNVTTSRAYIAYGEVTALLPNIRRIAGTGDIMCDKLPYKTVVPNMQQENQIAIGKTDSGVSLRLNGSNIEECESWLNNNPLKISYALATPVYEPLEIEPTLNTYNDITHISNNSIIPCTMKIKNTGYNAIIKPSTLYTVALDTNKSGTIGMNLGGAKGTTTNNVLKLTTPATLTDDSLRLYGKGIKGSKVRLLEGDKTNWIPSFFEGMKSSFEDKFDATDNTYKMEILSNNRNLFDINKVHSAFTVNNNTISTTTRAYNTSIFNNTVGQNTIQDVTKLLKLKKGTYTVGCTTNNNLVICLINTDGSFKNALATLSSELKERTFTLTNNSYIDIKLSNPNLDYVVSDIQIEEGNTLTNYNYVEHKYNKIQFSSIEPLRGVGNIKDRFMFKDGKLMIERNCGRKYLDGTNCAWAKHSSSTTEKTVFWSSHQNANITNKKSGECRCDTLKANSSSDYAINTLTSGFAYVTFSTWRGINDTTTLNKWFSENPTNVIYILSEPTYEEVPFELQKIILEGYENGTLFFDTNIPPTVTTTYAGETPIVKSVRLNKTEVLNNTSDINDNIVPYLMDMDFRVVCLQLEGGIENISMVRLFGGTYEMLQRDIQSKRYSVDEYKHRLDIYLSANKVTEDEYKKLGDMLNE